MKIEITKQLNLSNDQALLIDMHSFINIFNILKGELDILALILETDALDESKKIVMKMYRSLANIEETAFFAENINVIESRIISEVKSAVSEATEPDDRFQADFSVDNINSIFSILKVRFAEILSRLNAKNVWSKFNNANLRNNFIDIFNAIEKNSRESYHFVYNLAERRAKDYFITFDIKSIDGDTIMMPPVIQDVIRDLLANARKYTLPGGTISAGLYYDGETLRFSVEDNGRGIPESELVSVIDFGYRASNTTDRPTMGAGFGLTKAYFNIKKYNGRLWIDSVENKGTTITFEIPVNQSLNQA